MVALPAWGVPTAQQATDSGLAALNGDTMNLAAAHGEFNRAISIDATYGPAYVARVMVKIAQLYDTTDLKALRAAYGDTKTYDTFSLGIFNGISGRISPHSNHRYTYNSSTMDARSIQAVLGGPILSALNSALADLTTAEGLTDTSWQMTVPGRFISSDTNAEVDIADAYFFHAIILAAKAGIHILTSVNADAGRDWREFRGSDHDRLPEGDTIVKHIQANGSFLTQRPGASDSMVVAMTSLALADTAFLRFLRYASAETDVNQDPQDTDLIPVLASSKRTIWGQHITANDTAQFERRHSDTFVKVIAGDTFLIKNKKGNQDLPPFSVRARAILDTPLSRAAFPASQYSSHGFEFNEPFFPDPTFGGLVPGMTNNDLFLLFHEADTYFIVTTGGTKIDLNTISPLPKVIDVKFNVSPGPFPVVIKRATSGTPGIEWSLSVSPQSFNPSHLRIFYNPRSREFSSAERAQIAGAIDSTLLYIAPWKMSGGHAVDAGLSFVNFLSTYQFSGGPSNRLYDTFTFMGVSTTYDTLVMFRFGADDSLDRFKPVFQSFGVSLSSPSRRVATVDLHKFGWFLMGEQIPLIRPIRGFLEGDANAFLHDSFVVQISNDLNVPSPGITVTFNLPGSSERPAGATAGSFDTNVVTTDTFGKAYASYKMGDKPGVYRISVSASGLSTAYLFAFTTGFTIHPANLWRMISMPVYPAATLPAPALGETVSLGASGLARFGPKTSVSNFINDDFSNYKFFYWDPSQTNSSPDFNNTGHRHYITPSDVQMGRAYWFKTTVGGTLDAVQGDSTYTKIDKDGTPETVVLPLHAGWNMIGTPYAFSLVSKELLIDTGPRQPVPIDSVPTSVLTHQLYWIVPGNNANPGSGGYQQGPGFAHAEVGLFPFGGYWINVVAGCTLVFPPYGSGPSTGEFTEGGTGGAGGAGASPYILSSPPNARRLADDWTVQLYAIGPVGSDYENFAGVRPATSAASSYYEPPLAPGGVGLSFAEGGKNYSQALKTPDEQSRWLVDVKSAASGPVTIRAANTQSVPEGTPVKIRDESTGVVTDLRSSSYTYESYPDESRRFTFAAGDLEPSLRARIFQPVACVVTRIFGQKSFAQWGRTIRDAAMRAAWGRAAVRAYYDFSAALVG